MEIKTNKSTDISKLNLGLSVLGVFGFLVILLPILALLSKVPWNSFFSLLNSPSVIKALDVSIRTSILAAIISALLGVPLAWYIARGAESQIRWIRPIVISPLVLPPTVSGLALLTLFGRNGFIGKWLYEATGYSIPFTQLAVVLAGVFVGMPFLVLVMESVFRQVPIEIEEAALTLGANPTVVFWKISLPLARSGIVTGTVLAWARALGEFGATLAFAGSLPGVTRTMSMAVYSAMETELGEAYVLSAILIAIALIVVFFLRNSLSKTFARK